MIYKVLLLSLALVSWNQAQAFTSNDEVDLTGLNSQANDAVPGKNGWGAWVGFDSSSFMYKSDARGTSSTTIEAELTHRYDSRIFHVQGDLELYTFANNTPELGYNSRELYIQTQPELMAGNQVTVGRKVVEWSKLDKTWTMMSLWSPRYTWDELHPEIVGMTGIFYSYHDTHWEVVAFGSPLAIPELGTPTKEENNNIVSPNPFWKPLPTQETIMNSPRELRYSLLTPPLQDILLRPNFALRARFQMDNGLWISANSGVLPVNMIQMAAEIGLQPTTQSYVQVNIHPEFPMRNINTLEAGWDGPHKEWSLWLSGSYEQPFQFENEPTWLNPIITPSSIISAGTSLQVTSNFRFEGAVLFINEKTFTPSSVALQGVNVQLPSRFPLKQGIKVSGNWRFSDLTTSNFCWIQDLLQQNHFLSADVEHHFRHSAVTAGLGTDILIASSNQGWVGQYYGDDRVRGWLKYAF